MARQVFDRPDQEAQRAEGRRHTRRRPGGVATRREGSTGCAGRRAKTTWRGCRRTATSHEPGPRGLGSVRERSGERAGNVVNPMVGCRVQQTCRVMRGENRRSREERQGRNEFGVWQPRAEGTWPRSRGRGAGSGRAALVSTEGNLWTTPREESDQSMLDGPGQRRKAVLRQTGRSWKDSDEPTSSKERTRPVARATAEQSAGTSDQDGTPIAPR